MGLSSSRPNPLDQIRLDGKVVVVTGANTGIGKESAKDFFIRGAKVYVACRNTEKGDQAIKDIKEECKEKENLGSLESIQLDLSSLESVRECANKLINSNDKIDILLNNAGVAACPYTKTKDGFEMQFGTNHLGHFLFTLLLLPKIIASDSNPARIVNVSALAHKTGTLNFDDIHYEKRSYSPVGAYCQSKIANILFTVELAKKLEAAGLKDKVHAYSLHPGIIKTELSRHLDDTFFKGFKTISQSVTGMFFKTPAQGAQTSIYCCISEEAGKETGLYYSGSQVVSASAKATNADDAARLWTESLKMVGLKEDYNPFVKQ